ncbi:MAG: PAS domain-containing protein [Deltaproteobacteria bacterium]|nr:PAS domain-containing protein [Deltaproteobacteria bacterium]
MPKTKDGGPKKTTKKTGSEKEKAEGLKKAAEQEAGDLEPQAEAPPPPVPAEEKEAPAERLFPIVGVGASAGGLEAFTQLLENLPLDTGIGFVLVQHMAPRAHSMLPEILAKTTRMPVTEVKDGMRVEQNRIYVTPPDITMSLENGVLHLASRTEPRFVHRPIDSFLRSLAEDQGSRAIGVILSGTASDGVLGLQAIKAEGGITFAQDLKTAKYPGMPESAIAAGHVDFVLSPEKIAKQLARLAHHPLVTAPPIPKEKEAELPPEEESIFNQVLMLIKAHTGLDLTYYKHSTIKRRITRRMMLRQVERLEDYLKYLRQHSEEVKSLYEDILINVTSFFREPEAFEALQKVVFPELLHHRAEDEPIRVWVPGCATGEEAYSLAISLLEFLGELAAKVQIQVFATDVEEAVIDKARQGIYPESITADVSHDRLRRFFVKVPGGYQVSKNIRAMCVFAKQNLIKDPPFSRLDLISCRNVLIYFGPVLQKKVIPIFHFALKPGGFLLLGKSEALSAFPELFTLVDKKLKIFLKKTAVAPHFVLPTLGVEPARPPIPGKVAKLAEEIISPQDLQQEADRTVLARFAPAGVVIDANLNIIQFRGHTGTFLEPAPGEASLNLIKMAKEGLQIELRAAVHAAQKKKAPVRKEGLRVRHNGDIRTVNLEVFPLRASTALERFFLVVFEDVTPLPMAVKPPLKVKESKGKPSAKDREIEELNSELAVTKEYLQAVIEEQETSVEELKSTNEELMSANEELQSINEEMETSKEELQSANEELATLNEELENRNQELTQTNNDLNNLLTVVQIAIVMLGPDLRIRRFNQAAQDMLNLLPADVGRPIGDIRLKVTAPELESRIHEVMTNLSTKEIEVQDREGHWYSLRLRPYRTSDNKIEGVVMALVDIEAQKCNLQEVQEARDLNQTVINTLLEPLVVLDSKMNVILVNKAYKQIFQLDADTEGRSFFDIANRQWDLGRLRQLLKNILSADKPFANFVMEQEFPKLGRRIMRLNGVRLPMGGPGKDRILLSIEDITDREKAEGAVKESEGKLRKLSQQLLAMQDKERHEFSTELHEELAQNITALKMELRTFEPKLPEADGKLRQDYHQVLGKIDELIENVRRRAMDLSPQMLADLGLNKGLEILCQDDKVECLYDLDDLTKFFTEKDQINIYRIFQEAMSNVRQHAQATKVTLSAKKTDDRVDFLLEDNGQGFDVGRMEDLEAGRKGIGLSAMSERVRALGGALKIESQVGVGTRVFFSIPVEKQ